MTSGVGGTQAKARQVAASIVTASASLLPLAAATQRTAVNGTARLAAHEQQRANASHERSAMSVMLMQSIGSIGGASGDASAPPEAQLKRLALHYLETYQARPTALRPTLLVSDPLAVLSSTQGRHEGGAAYEQPVGALTRTTRVLNAQHAQQATAAVAVGANAAVADVPTARDAIAAAVELVTGSPPQKLSNQAAGKAGGRVNTATSPSRPSPPAERSYNVVPPNAVKYVSLADEVPHAAASRRSDASGADAKQQAAPRLATRPPNVGVPKVVGGGVSSSKRATSTAVAAVGSSSQVATRGSTGSVPEHASSTAPTTAAARESSSSAAVAPAAVPKPRSDNPRDPSPQPRPWNAPSPTPLTTPAPAATKRKAPRDHDEGPQYRTSKLIAKRLAEEAARGRQGEASKGGRSQASEHQREVLSLCVDRLVERGLQDVVLLRPPVPGAPWRRPVALESMAGLRDGAILAALCNLLTAAHDRRSPLRLPRSPQDDADDGGALQPRPRVTVATAPRATCGAVVHYLRERLPSAIPTAVLEELPVPASAIDSLRPDLMVDGKQNEALFNVVIYLLDVLDVIDALEASNAAAMGGARLGVPASARRSSSSDSRAALGDGQGQGGHSEPLSASRGRRYSPEHMSQLDAAACQFLLGLGILPEPHDALRRQLHHRGPPTALEAPYVPLRHHLPKRTTPISTVVEPFVFPFLCNGTALCDAVIAAFNLSPFTVRRNPKTQSDCVKNIEAAQLAVRHHPRHPPAIFLEDPVRVFEGDRDYILLLLEDIMRCAHDVAPRDGPPTPSQSPFLPSFHQAAPAGAGPSPPKSASAPGRGRSVSPAHTDATATSASSRPPSSMRSGSARAPSAHRAYAAPAPAPYSVSPASSKRHGSPLGRRSGGVVLSSPLASTAFGYAGTAATMMFGAAGSGGGLGVTAGAAAAFGASSAAAAAATQQASSTALHLSGAARVLTDAFDAVTPPRERSGPTPNVAVPKPTPPHQVVNAAGGTTQSGMVPGFYSDERDGRDSDDQRSAASATSSAAIGRPPLRPSGASAASVESASNGGSGKRRPSQQQPPPQQQQVTPPSAKQLFTRGSSVGSAEEGDSMGGSPARTDGDAAPYMQLHFQNRVARPERLAPGLLDHLPYLSSVVLDPSENFALRRWLLEKLGPQFRHEASGYDPAAFAKETAEDRGNMKWLDATRACYLLDDGVVLARLVETLAYAKAGEVAVIDTKARSTAARRQNLSRVLRYLAREKKILFDAPYLEEALEAGDVRAVVLTLRAVKAAYPLHGVSLKPHPVSPPKPAAPLTKPPLQLRPVQVPPPAPVVAAAATAAPAAPVLDASTFRIKLDPGKWARLNQASAAQQQQQQHRHADPELDGLSPPSPLNRTKTLAELAGVSPPDS